jgi:hypothetical protein
VKTPSGIRVEVKSSAYLQSWNQRRVSNLKFSGLTGRSWSADTNLTSEEREFRADVYVFAIHTCREPNQYDALNIRHWEFRVVGATVLRKRGYRSITMRLLDGIAPTRFTLDELAETVERDFSRTASESTRAA